MKKVIVSFLIILIGGCNRNDSVKKTVDNNSPDQNLIKYPLPQATDSLLALLKTVQEDTNKVNVLNELGWGFRNKLDTAIILGNQALELSKKINWKMGMANSLRTLGTVELRKAEVSKSLDYHLQALKIFEELNYVVGMASCYANIGGDYTEQANYPKAIDYYLKALKIYEGLKNKSGISKQLNNIGIVYYHLSDYPKVLEYDNKALKINEELGDKKAVARTLANMGIVYYEQGDNPKTKPEERKVLYEMALENYFKSLKINEEAEINSGIAVALGNIGLVYASKGKYSAANSDEQKQSFDLAQDYYFKALVIRKKIGNYKLIASTLGNLGILYTNKAEKLMERNSASLCFKDSYNYLQRAIVISDSIGAKDQLVSWYAALSDLYEKSVIPLTDLTNGKILNMEEMRLSSLHYFKIHMNLQDTLLSEENKKQLMRKEMKFQFERKEAESKAAQDKKDALAMEELKLKEKERNYFVVGFALVIMLAGFIFRGYQQKQKTNEIISLQKSLVEEKQKEILDSIHYAKRIQRSLLPTEKYIQKNITRLYRN